MASGVPNQYTKQQLTYIEANKTLPRVQLAKAVNKRFGLNVTTAAIKGLCTRKGWKTGRTGQFKKGVDAWNKGKKGYMGENKTSFKKGHKPHNIMPVGSIKYCTNDNYQWTKIAEPNVWKQTHYILWEAENGKVKKGHCLRFKDGNKGNITLNNIEAVSLAENCRLNQMDYNNSPEELKPTIKLIAQISTKERELSNA